MRQFEFPYNFDKNLIQILHTLDPNGNTINCIYLPPFMKDYKTILRTGEQAFYLDNITRDEYEEHISFINSLFPGKIKILLQKEDQLLNEDGIKYYLSLGIKKYCVASCEQAKIIKNIDKNINVIGSIVMQVNSDKLKSNLSEYSKYFNGFVLPFRHSRDLEDIKKMPKNFYYILLINAYCNTHCSGKHHWMYEYKDDQGVKCPGIYTGDPNPNNQTSWETCARIRPMDLGFFDPYIYIYKLQDRGWPTPEIIRDYVLYTTNYNLYPGITYDERMYYNDSK